MDISKLIDLHVKKLKQGRVALLRYTNVVTLIRLIDSFLITYWTSHQLQQIAEAACVRGKK